MHPVHQELVVQVRPGGPAGCADVADGLPLAHSLALAQAARETGKVQILGLVALSMLQDEVVAVGGGAGLHDHFAGSGGAHLGAGWRGVVDAEVRHRALPQRVLAAPVEVRADAREVHRRPQERLVHVLAGRRVVLDHAGLVFVAHRGVHVALIDELRHQDVAEADALAIQTQILVQNVELVAGAGVEDEVDVPLEDAPQALRELVPQPDALASQKQRLLDDAVRVGGVPLRLAHHARALERVAQALEHHRVQPPHAVLHVNQPALLVTLELELVTGLDGLQALAQRAAVDEQLQIALAQAVAGEDGAQIVAWPHGGSQRNATRLRRGWRRRHWRGHRRGGGRHWRVHVGRVGLRIHGARTDPDARQRHHQQGHYRKMSFRYRHTAPPRSPFPTVAAPSGLPLATSRFP